MSCEACTRHVERSLSALHGVVHARVDLQRNEAIVEHLPAYSDVAALIAAVGEAGYNARVASTVDDSESTPPRSQASSCRCGCCASPRSQGWSELGTSTIG